MEQQYTASDRFTIRAYALEQAVKLYAGKAPSPTNPVTRNSEIIEAANRFEAYLSEQPADQQATTPPRVSEKMGA